MTVPMVSAMLAAALIIVMMILKLSVGLYRGKVRVGVGVGDNPELERKVRRHGNLSENAALFVATLALAEIIGGSGTVISTFAAVFFAARMFHIIGFSSQSGSHRADGFNPFLAMRFAGAMLTVLSGIALGGYLILLIQSTM